MKLQKCPNNHYTLKEICPICNQQTKSAHYKFIKLRDVNDKRQDEEYEKIKNP